MDRRQFRELVSLILDKIGLGGPDAVELLMLTAATESRLGHYVHQVGGPARGVFQMEPATEDDIWRHFILPDVDRTQRVLRLCSREFQPLNRDQSPAEMEFNLAYATAMCRMHYRRVREPLPDSRDIETMAAYWKRFYNTRLGAGTVEKAVKAYKELCL